MCSCLYGIPSYIYISYVYDITSSTSDSSRWQKQGTLVFLTNMQVFLDLLGSILGPGPGSIESLAIRVPPDPRSLLPYIDLYWILLILIESRWARVQNSARLQISHVYWFVCPLLNNQWFTLHKGPMGHHKQYGPRGRAVRRSGGRAVVSFWKGGQAGMSFVKLIKTNGLFWRSGGQAVGAVGQKGVFSVRLFGWATYFLGSRKMIYM